MVNYNDPVVLANDLCAYAVSAQLCSFQKANWPPPPFFFYSGSHEGLPCLRWPLPVSLYHLRLALSPSIVAYLPHPAGSLSLLLTMRGVLCEAVARSGG